MTTWAGDGAPLRKTLIAKYRAIVRNPDALIDQWLAVTRERTGIFPRVARFGGISAQQQRAITPPAAWAARRIPCVAPDNVAAARAATERLIQAGHRRIAILDDFAQASYYAERERGYRDALEAHGLAAPDGLIRRGRALAPGPYTMDAINRVAPVIELLRLPPGEAPTALFAANYHYALAALEAVRQLRDQGRSLAVPGDLSLIGFDDVPEFRRTTPAITCVHYPIRALAQVAIDKLLALIADPRDAVARMDARIADIQIAERDSIAPPPTPHPA